MLINLRNALMSGKRLPYDAEVEYLESTGTQWIDTGVIGKPDTVADISFRWVGNQSGDAIILGCRNNSISAPRFIMLMTNATKIRQLGVGGDWKKNGYYDMDVDYRSVSSFTSSLTTQKLDGITVISSKNAIADTGLNLALFGNNVNGNITNIPKARVYQAKIYTNNILVRDYIPVRVGTVGYLYDRVSGKLFGNAGTGDFVLGPDVVPVEWLESDGNQYIDTGVKPDATYTFDSTVAVMQSNYNCVYWGCRSSGTYQTYNNQCYLTSNTSSTAVEKFRRIRLLSTGVDSNANWDSGIVPQTGVFYQLSEMSTVSTMNTMTYPVILFGLNNIGQILTNVGNARIAKWTAYKGGAKANNFLPVRVGTEGAMIDTLTRRIYRNAGTGAFGYGNDLKYPIPAS